MMFKKRALSSNNVGGLQVRKFGSGGSKENSEPLDIPI